MQYALLLEAYVELFRPDPERLLWIDLDILQAVRTARAGMDNDTAKKVLEKTIRCH